MSHQRCGIKFDEFDSIGPCSGAMKIVKIFNLPFLSNIEILVNHGVTWQNKLFVIWYQLSGIWWYQSLSKRHKNWKIFQFVVFIKHCDIDQHETTKKNVLSVKCDLIPKNCMMFVPIPAPIKLNMFSICHFQAIQKYKSTSSDQYLLTF